jgi:hypothetical protein
MVNCSDLDELNMKFRIAMLRHGRFVDSLKGLVVTATDDQKLKRLEDEMDGARRAWLRHLEEHRCRP